MRWENRPEIGIRASNHDSVFLHPAFYKLRKSGFTGGKTIVKDYISAHHYLVPAPRHAVEPQGNRGRRYSTGPGEAFQMDWGFTKVQAYDGSEYNAACFAMICHHCGQRYVEFFPNAKQENLFIGMIHAFRYMGVPQYVLTDNMKSVVIRRDLDGNPIWQKDYEQFMKTVGFQTKLCKPRHPFTKGKVERLVRFVKENFLVGRVFWNVTDTVESRSVGERTYYKYTDGKKVQFTVKAEKGMRAKCRKYSYTIDFEVTPHLLRHTYITNLLLAGTDIKTVQYLAGYEKSKTTLDIYAHLTYNRPEDIIDKVNCAFQNKK